MQDITPVHIIFGIALTALKASDSFTQSAMMTKLLFYGSEWERGIVFRIVEIDVFRI